jgi:hypothetical protein
MQTHGDFSLRAAKEPCRRELEPKLSVLYCSFDILRFTPGWEDWQLHEFDCDLQHGRICLSPTLAQPLIPSEGEDHY